jgi:hypothetical protein
VYLSQISDNPREISDPNSRRDIFLFQNMTIVIDEVKRQAKSNEPDQPSSPFWSKCFWAGGTPPPRHFRPGPPAIIITASAHTELYS